MTSVLNAHEATLTYHDDTRTGYENRPRELSVARNRDGSWLWSVDCPGIAIRQPLKSGMCGGDGVLVALANAIVQAEQQDEVWEFYR